MKTCVKPFSAQMGPKSGLSKNFSKFCEKVIYFMTFPLWDRWLVNKKSKDIKDFVYIFFMGTQIGKYERTYANEYP